MLHKGAWSNFEKKNKSEWLIYNHTCMLVVLGSREQFERNQGSTHTVIIGLS